MRRAFAFGIAPFVLTAGLVVMLGVGVIPAARAIGIWLLCLATLLLHRFARDVGTADASALSRRFDDALRARNARGVTVPAELVRMENEIVLAVANADDSHRRLLPLLRTAAAARLAALHGIDLVRSPAEAHARLGDDAWDLLRPDRPAPANRHGPGVPREVLAQLIARVERL